MAAGSPGPVSTKPSTANAIAEALLIPLGDRQVGQHLLDRPLALGRRPAGLVVGQPFDRGLERGVGLGVQLGDAVGQVVGGGRHLFDGPLAEGDGDGAALLAVDHDRLDGVAGLVAAQYRPELVVAGRRDAVEGDDHVALDQAGGPGAAALDRVVDVDALVDGDALFGRPVGVEDVEQDAHERPAGDAQVDTGLQGRLEVVQAAVPALFRCGHVRVPLGAGAETGVDDGDARAAGFRLDGRR